MRADIIEDTTRVYSLVVPLKETSTQGLINLGDSLKGTFLNPTCGSLSRIERCCIPRDLPNPDSYSGGGGLYG